MRCLWISVVFVMFSVAVESASHNNCRLVHTDKELFHRRIQQEATRRRKVFVVNYPEVLIDRHPMRPKVITCIRCQDLQQSSRSEDSVCRIMAGGVGYSFAKIKLMCFPHKSCDYGIRILGH